MRPLLAVILPALVLPAPAQPFPPTDAWTLEAAIAQATTASPEARLAEARVLAATATAAEAEAHARPSVTLRAGYLQTNSPMQAFGAILNQGTFDNTIDFNRPGQLDAFSASLEARYALYTGGRLSASRAAARAAQAASAAAREDALQRLALEVVRAYFLIRQADARVEALTAALASFDENVRIGRLREAAGQLLSTERLNLEVQRAQTAENLLSARHAAALARRRFGFLLGLPAGAPVALADDDRSPERLVEPEPGTAATRPEQLALERQAEAAERQVRAARAARLPSVDAFASAQADRGWRRDGSGESWSAGVLAELPVFDGGVARARIRAAEAALLATREQLAQLELAHALELEQARLALELAREQVAVTGQTVAQAEESARLSRERFAAGALLSAELIAVETRLADVRVRRTQALTQERIAIAELRRASGLPVFE